MESLVRDFRIANPRADSHPGFTAVAVLTLALGIGATTSVFSVVYGVLIRPLPFPAAIASWRSSRSCPTGTPAARFALVLRRISFSTSKNTPRCSRESASLAAPRRAR
jgi:hypothetical protein